MLTAASNPIIAQASAWLAVVMLLVQSLPAASCGCGESEVSNGRHVAHAAACCGSNATTESCCAAEAKPTCCSMAKRRSCCGKDQDDRPLAQAKSCSCGATCSCKSAPAPAEKPAVPGPQEDNRHERLELVTMSPTAAIGMVSICPSAPRLGYAEFLIPATALDRCIELSRFTC